MGAYKNVDLHKEIKSAENGINECQINYFFYF